MHKRVDKRSKAGTSIATGSHINLIKWFSFPFLTRFRYSNITLSTYKALQDHRLPDLYKSVFPVSQSPSGRPSSLVLVIFRQDARRFLFYYLHYLPPFQYQESPWPTATDGFRRRIVHHHLNCLLHLSTRLSMTVTLPVPVEHLAEAQWIFLAGRERVEADAGE